MSGSTSSQRTGTEEFFKDSREKKDYEAREFNGWLNFFNLKI